MEGDSGLDVLSNDGILDIIPASEYDPFEVNKYFLTRYITQLIYVFVMYLCHVRYKM